MRLLNARTLQLEEFFNNPRGIPDYAILSHTWGVEEVTLEAMRNGSAQNKLQFQKIQFACRQAGRDCYEYVWVDTCCIDKSSSSELSEAINSMFEWYRKSKVCYAYLEGISAEDADDARVPDDYHMLPGGERAFRESKFAQHRWFKRGWTLQELIAPSRIELYGKNWEYLGSSLDFLSEIVSITGIDDKVLGVDTTLKMEFLRRTTVAQRMSWGASRSTTRLEDEAYCLLGLFDVNMPLLYGEGATAFIRLQEEIIKVSTDHSIFAWQSTTNAGNGGLVLAPSVSCFGDCGTVRPLREQIEQEPYSPYSMANARLSIRLPVVTITNAITEDTATNATIAILPCRYSDNPLGPIGLCLQSTGGKAYYVSSNRSIYGERLYGLHKNEGRAFAVDLKHIPKSTRTQTLLLLRRPPTDFSLPLAPLALDRFAKETATAFLIREDFGSRGKSPWWMRLDFSIKALYPSMWWSKTPAKLPDRDGQDILLLPPQIHAGAIRIWYRATSFFITFGLERRNWHKEPLECWIKIYDSENDMTMREAVHLEQKPHCVDGFAVSKYGKNKATLIPKRFPDDCLEVSISRKYAMGDEMFEISGKVKKLTISSVVMVSAPPPWTDATGEYGPSQRRITYPSSSVIQFRSLVKFTLLIDVCEVSTNTITSAVPPFQMLLRGEVGANHSRDFQMEVR